MQKSAIALAAVAVLGSALVAAPAEARGWGHRSGGWGPGIGFGLAAGALAAGAYGGYGPYGYGPRYYGYGPAYYGGGPYAYGGPRYYRHRYYRHY
jgi:hypothetical protein